MGGKVVDVILDSSLDMMVFFLVVVGGDAESKSSPEHESKGHFGIGVIIE